MKKRIFDIVIIITVMVGACIMITNSGGALSSEGLDNLKYYTVLSNIFCGIAALIRLLYSIMNKKSERKNMFIRLLKLSATGVVSVTFLTILLFLGPIYGHINLYQGANLWFHLIVPIIALIDFCLTNEGKPITFLQCIYTSAPTIVYGTAYLVNILLNGTGEWPKTNDWYGFVNWGLPVGIVIFAAITAVNVLVNFSICFVSRKTQ